MRRGEIQEVEPRERQSLMSGEELSQVLVQAGDWKAALQERICRSL